MAGIPSRQIPRKPLDLTTPDRATAERSPGERPVAERPVAKRAAAVPAVASSSGSIFLYGVDACLAAVMLVVPFVMGGRIVAGEILLCGLAVGVAGCWSLHRLCGREQGWRWTGMELLFLPALGLMVLQLLPLDSGMMNLLSPKLYDLLPLWSPQSDASDRLGIWTQLSLYPAMTRQGLTLLVAYTLLFFTTVQRIRTSNDVERLLTWMGLAACAMALFGLVQFFAGNGKFFWIYEHPQTTTSDYVKGAFSNRNHFAHFLALGVGPLLWLLLRFFLPQSGSSRKSANGKEIIAGIAAVGLGCVIFAALLSLSRGGALSLFTAGGVGLLLFWRAATLNGRILLGMGLVLLFVGVGLAMYGQESVGNRLDDFISGDLKRLDHKDGRMDLWSTVWRAGNAFSMVGAGVGTHRELYPAYLQTPVGVDFTHAENGYLQMFEETGVCGLGLMALGILACGLCCLRGVACRQPVLAGCAAALGASLAASTVHSLMDFVWYVPGIMGVMSILTAALFRISSLASEQSGGAGRMMPIPRLAWVAGLLAVCGAGAWSTPQLVARLQAEPHWIAYQRLAVDHSLTQAAEEDSKGQPDSKSIIGALQNIVKENPDDARAHARLARVYLTQFERMQQKSENSMTVAQIRDAVLASKFESSKDEEAWLNKAVGKPRKLLDLAYKHSLEAIRRCPLQGDVYLFFSQLVFLKDPNKTDLSPYWEQSVRLRPYDGMVLLSAGQEYFSRQEFDQAFQYWQRAFQCGGTPRDTLIQSLAGQLKAEQFLKIFTPDVETSLQVVKRYQALKQPAEVQVALKYTAKASEESAKKLDGTLGAHTWLTAFNAYKELKAAKPALACLKKAYDADPSDYDVRFAYGQWALEQKDFATAEEHLEWCSDHRPADDTLKEMAKYASKNAIGKRVSREIAELPEEDRAGASRR